MSDPVSVTNHYKCTGCNKPDNQHRFAACEGAEWVLDGTTTPMRHRIVIEFDADDDFSPINIQTAMESLAGDLVDAFAPGGCNLMGYHGPFVTKAAIHGFIGDRRIDSDGGDAFIALNDGDYEQHRNPAPASYQGFPIEEAEAVAVINAIEASIEQVTGHPALAQLYRTGGSCFAYRAELADPKYPADERPYLLITDHDLEAALAPNTESRTGWIVGWYRDGDSDSDNAEDESPGYSNDPSLDALDALIDEVLNDNGAAQ